MRARYVIESERWSDMKGQASFDNVDELFALGMSAWKLGDDKRLYAAVGQFEKLVTSGSAGELREVATIMLHELGALLMWSQGQRQEAFILLDDDERIGAGFQERAG